jgi:hypothetical protein
MSTNNKPTNTSNKNQEEVDLGSLFIIIGKGFSSFFNFIASILKGLFHLIITIFIFFKENSVKIGTALIIGLISGLFLETKKELTYASDLLVSPNYSSARQLYNNVNYYNDLVQQKDTLRIQQTFNLDKETAASIKKFTIKPVKNTSDLINSYNLFVTSVDTLTLQDYTFKDFESSFTDLNYHLHKVQVIASKNDVFDKLADVILGSVIKNKYFNRVKELNNENLDRTDAIIRNNIGQTDSLRKVYMQVMLEEARKESSGTSIDLGGQKSTTKELELFETNRTLNKELSEVVKEKSLKYEVINVISNFQPIGYEMKGVTKNYAFIFGALSSGLMILFLLLVKFNVFLTNYRK